MSDSKEYILRRPIMLAKEKISIGHSVTIDMYTHNGYGVDVFATKTQLDELFREFDREQLKQQLIELLKKERPILPDDFINTADLADEIMSVCFGEETNK